MLPCRASAGVERYPTARRARHCTDVARVVVVAHPARGYTLPRPPVQSRRFGAGAA